MSPTRRVTPAEWIGTILAAGAVLAGLLWVMTRVRERVPLGPESRPAFRPELR